MRNKKILVYESIVNKIWCDGVQLFIYDKLTKQKRTMPPNEVYKQLYKDKLCTK